MRIFLIPEQKINITCRDFSEGLSCENNTLFYTRQYFPLEKTVHFDFTLISENFSEGDYSICLELISVSSLKNNKEKCIDFNVAS